LAGLHILHKLFEWTDSLFNFSAAAKARSDLTPLERHHRLGQGDAAADKLCLKVEMMIHCQIWTGSLNGKKCSFVD
jgi:hypothetical protein